MKTRMVLIAAALLLFAAASFGQGGFAASFTTEYQLRASTLTGCDAGEPLPDGTVIEIHWDQNNNDIYEDGVDPLFTVCPGQPCPTGTVNYNTFTINSADQGMLPGQFYTDTYFSSFGPVGTLANVPTYLVVRCSDGTVHYVSNRVLVAYGLPNEYICTWNCFPCLTVPPCQPSNDLTITANGSGHPWLISNCLHLCANSPVPVLVHICSGSGAPLDPTKPPVSTWHPGCTEPCTEECPPTQAIVLGPVYNPATGCWDYAIGVLPGAPDGCICFTFERFLAVGFNNDFQALASDGAVNLSWSTSSADASLARYDIIRNSDKVGEVAAANTGNAYHFVDSHAVNGTTYTYTLRAVNVDGSVSDLMTTASVTPSFGAAVITEYALHQNFPNPFNPTTDITFDVVDKNLVSLKVYNAAGQEVATVANGEFEAGRHIVSFNASNLPSGLYFYSVKIGNDFSATKKMLLVK